MVRLNRQQSRILAVGIIVGFFVIGGALLSNQRRGMFVPPVEPVAEPARSEPLPPEVQSSAAPTPTPDDTGAVHVLNEFHRSESKNGKKLWEITGARAEYLMKENAARLTDAKLSLYRPDDQTVQIEAQHALLHLNGSSFTKLEASGAVVLKRGAEFTLKTELATYDGESQVVHAPGAVTILNGRLEILGEDLTAHVQDESMHLARNVRTTIHPEAQ